MSKWIEKKSAPVLPLYACGAVWLVCGILLPVYRLWAFALTLVLSVAVYFVMNALCPKRVTRVEQGFMTGSEDVDEMLRTMAAGKEKLQQLETAIGDARIKNDVSRMKKACAGIVEEVEAHPEKAKQVRRFANYYLPDTIKIFSSYADIEHKGTHGENAEALKKRVTEGADDIASAFEKQLDCLFESDAVNVDVDMDVLQNILKGEGLS